MVITQTGLLKKVLRVYALLFLSFFVLVGIASAALVDNGDGTITDTVSGLQWQKYSMDLNGDSVPDQMTWEQALAACQGLNNLGGHSDWRLPNILELRSIADYSRYGPAINSIVFPDTVSSSYWSSTTNAQYYNIALELSFYLGADWHDDKSASLYVRAVRGGQCDGAFGRFGSFIFDTINSPVDPETCVQVRGEARTAGGALDTSVNSDIPLSVNYGSVSPNVLHFINGIGSAENNCVKIYGYGENKQLTVQGQGRYGESGYFSSGTGYCVGRVEVHTNISGATVILNKVVGGEYSRQDTNSLFYAAFDNVPCNSYTVRVEKDGHSYEDDKPLNVDFLGNTYIHSVHLPKTGAKTPVVLIPGIMGSTNRGASGLKPYFKGNYPDEDIAVLAPGPTGWNKMKRALEDVGHPVVFCPWDWRGESRESMKKNVETFLIPAINNALNYTSGGKVDIVAHSMGGLLARAYIQSDAYRNRNDVSRLALVAVPNLGSANPYFLIEAGDSKTTKTILDDDFYEKTIKKLWKKTYDKPNWKSCKTSKIRDFLHDYSPGVYQLMHTKKFLKFNNTKYGVMQGDNVNTWLKALNGGTNGFEPPANVFEKPDGSGNKVKTRVFAGKLSDKKTLRWIETAGTVSSLYPDGQPLDYRSCSSKDKVSPTHVIWGDGDGTVPWDSAVYPVAEKWADREVSTKIYWEKTIGNHGTIMRSFRDEIVAFLNGGGNGTTSTNAIAGKSLAFVTKAGVKGAADLTPELMFSVIGNIRLVVTDSQGRKSGIPAATGEMVNEIPETDIEANDAGMQITISNPSVGQYSLDYYGLSDGDYSLYVTAYDTSGEDYEDSFDGYRPDHQQTLVVSYDPAHAGHTTIQAVVTAPSDYESEQYDCATGKCARLLWKASNGAGVTGYVIYRSLSDEPFYTEMTRVAAGVTSYNTGEVWDNAEGYPVNGYGVSAIKADETESFFAKEKNDVMYIFPWPMFMPAMTGAGH